MDCSLKGESVLTNRTPSDRVVVRLRDTWPNKWDLLEIDRRARQARRDCVPLPDFKIKRRRAMR